MEKYLKYKQKYINLIVGGNEQTEPTPEPTLVKAEDKFSNIDINDYVVFLIPSKLEQGNEQDDGILLRSSFDFDAADDGTPEYLNIKIGRVANKLENTLVRCNIIIHSSGIEYELNSEFHKKRVFKVVASASSG
jgi:hypothetical protein